MKDVLVLGDKARWAELLSRLPSSQQDVYYSPQYYSLYQNNGDGDARCFVYEEDGELILYPFLLNRIIPLGYSLDKDYLDIQGAYGYNGIVTSSKDSSFISGFHMCFEEFCLEHDIIAEFSRFHPILSNHELASPLMRVFHSRNTVKLNLSPSWDDIWHNSFSPKNRNVIKKAEKNGVSIIESHDYELFRQMYNETMRSLNAEPFYFFPQTYYKELEEFLGNNLMLCFAIYEGKPISGSMFMFMGDYAHYHLSGRDRKYYKIAANNLVLAYAIQKAKERGCKWFHFGGGTTGDEADPLLHFKKNFSKETGEFWFGKRVYNQAVYNSIIEQWKEKYPSSYEKNSIKLLGYREI